VIKYCINIFFKQKHTKAILSNSTQKLLWLETIKMLIAVFKNKFIVLFIIIFGTLSSLLPVLRGSVEKKFYAHAGNI